MFFNRTYLNFEATGFPILEDWERWLPTAGHIFQYIKPEKE